MALYNYGYFTEFVSSEDGQKQKQHFGSLSIVTIQIDEYRFKIVVPCVFSVPSYNFSIELLMSIQTKLG